MNKKRTKLQEKELAEQKYNLVIVKSNPPYILYQRPTTSEEELTKEGKKVYKSIMYKVNPWLQWINKKDNKVKIGYCSCDGFSFRGDCVHIQKTKEDLQKVAHKFLGSTFDDSDLWIGIDTNYDPIPPYKVKELLKLKGEPEIEYKTSFYHAYKINNYWILKHPDNIEKDFTKELKDLNTILKLYKFKHNT